MLCRELQVLLQFINNSTATSMDTEVLKSLLEVRDIELPFGVEDFAANEGEKEKELLRSWKDKGSNGCDV